MFHHGVAGGCGADGCCVHAALARTMAAACQTDSTCERIVKILQITSEIESCLHEAGDYASAVISPDSVNEDTLDHAVKKIGRAAGALDRINRWFSSENCPDMADIWMMYITEKHAHIVMDNLLNATARLFLTILQYKTKKRPNGWRYHLSLHNDILKTIEMFSKYYYRYDKHSRRFVPTDSETMMFSYLRGYGEAIVHKSSDVFLGWQWTGALGKLPEKPTNDDAYLSSAPSIEPFVIDILYEQHFLAGVKMVLDAVKAEGAIVSRSCHDECPPYCVSGRNKIAILQTNAIVLRFADMMAESVPEPMNSDARECYTLAKHRLVTAMSEVVHNMVTDTERWFTLLVTRMPLVNWPANQHILPAYACVRGAVESLCVTRNKYAKLVGELTLEASDGVKLTEMLHGLHFIGLLDDRHST